MELNLLDASTHGGQQIDESGDYHVEPNPWGIYKACKLICVPLARWCSRNHNTRTNASVPADDEVQVEPGQFVWCSLDPESGKLNVYSTKQSLLLEAACRAGKDEVNIMIQPKESVNGLIATVFFNHPQAGEHTQRTMGGTGERKVQRADQRCVSFGTVQFKVPIADFVGFARMAWVSVDPVHGSLQPYTKENALIIEQAYHLKKSIAYVQVDLPNGNVLNVKISFDFSNGRHTQSTGSGLRSVSRIVCDSVPSEGVNIDLYRRPRDSTVDSERFRLHATEGDGQAMLNHVGTITVPEIVFMEESSLDSDAFSSLASLEVALAEMGYTTVQLNGVADCMKEEPMRQAAKVCCQEYQQNHDVQLLDVIDHILEEWVAQGLLPPEVMCADVSSSHAVHGIYEASVATLFTNCDSLSNILMSRLSPTRSSRGERSIGGKKIMLRMVAAAAVWRAVMQGA